MRSWRSWSSGWSPPGAAAAGAWCQGKPGSGSRVSPGMPRNAGARRLVPHRLHPAGDRDRARSGAPADGGRHPGPRRRAPRRGRIPPPVDAGRRWGRGLRRPAPWSPSGTQAHRGMVSRRAGLLESRRAARMHKHQDQVLRLLDDTRVPFTNPRPIDAQDGEAARQDLRMLPRRRSRRGLPGRSELPPDGSDAWPPGFAVAH